MKKDLLLRTVLILFFLTLFFGGLYFAAPFLKPLAIAFLITLLLLPLSRKLERRGMKRLWSTLISTFMVIFFIAFVFGLLFYQVNKMSSNAEQLQKKGKEKIEQIEQFISRKIGVTPEDIKKYFEKSGGSGITNMAGTFGMGFLTSLTDMFLMFVYIFLLLFYRHHLKEFILKLNKPENRRQVTKTMEESGNVAQKYLAGRLILMGILAVLYSIGLSALGVKYALFFSILAALLSPIPYIGNMIGAILPFLMAVVYNSMGTALGVLGVFTLTQAIENYFLEPLVVGKKVNLNPMITIIIAVLGGSIWGVAGMIIAIPYVAIFMIIFNKIDSLKPISFLLGEEEG